MTGRRAKRFDIWNSEVVVIYGVYLTFQCLVLFWGYSVHLSEYGL